LVKECAFRPCRAWQRGLQATIQKLSTVLSTPIVENTGVFAATPQARAFR
jgi:hypothetical protein